jgi:hypothetical protein
MDQSTCVRQQSPEGSRQAPTETATLFLRADATPVTQGCVVQMRGMIIIQGVDILFNDLDLRSASHMPQGSEHLRSIQHASYTTGIFDYCRSHRYCSRRYVCVLYGPWDGLLIRLSKSFGDDSSWICLVYPKEETRT